MTERDRDRGVSTVVSYVLVLGIVALLSSALIGAFGPFVTNQQQATAGSTLSVYGNDLAGDVESADRLVRESSAGATVEFTTRLPDQVAGSPYEIEIADQGGNVYEITLQTLDFKSSAFVTVRTATDVQPQTGADALDGGTLRVFYDTGSDELVIENA